MWLAMAGEIRNLVPDAKYRVRFESLDAFILSLVKIPSRSGRESGGEERT
tara:strand:- start:73 stop:222 length:150 start_codon:yes stop_codon:yes gene_type:complete